MADDTEWMKLPTDEKCQHKAWKARLAGYEEATKLFQTLGDEKSPEFSKYLGLIKKFVIDNNAIAQEKGLEASLAFVENYFHAGKAAGEVCAGIIAQCLNKRAKTKDLGVAILMTYIEAEKQEIVHEELMKGLTNKQPKIVSTCVTILRDALRDFGTKIISVKPILKQLQPLLEDRDKVVRDETKLLAVEIYHWIGPALKPQIASLKPLQLSELEAEFEKLPPGKPVQTRFLRSQQDLKAKMAEKMAATELGDGGEAADEVDAEVAPNVDPYDLIDPVDILSKLPKDFYEKIEEKKWQDRKEVLDAVQKLTENPKLEQGDYNELVRALKKVLAKDTNVLLVLVAAKCIGGLATGLRKKFAPHAPGCVEAILDKFREKKSNVVVALKEAIDACYVTTTLELISEPCIAALEHKTPSVKAETASFLARCFSTCTPTTLPKKLLKLFITALLKTVNDTAPEVREASFEAIGITMKVISEKALLPFLADVDALKMAKIKECCEKAVIAGKPSAVRPATTAEPAASKVSPPGRPGSVAPSKKDVLGKPAAKKDSDIAQSSSSSGAAAGSSGAGAAKKKPAGGVKGKKGADVKEEVLERELSDETVEEKMSALFPGGPLTGLDNANWKERLAACEKLLDVAKSLTRDEIPAQAFVRTIVKKPGLKETNFQVLKLKIDLLTYLALNSMFSKRSAEYCLTDLIDKIGDAKNGSSVHEALSAIAEATSLDFVAIQVVQVAFEQKNPKTQSESLVWLSGAIKDFGFKLPVKPLVEVINKALASANPAVRTAGITVLGVMYMYMGATLRVFFDNEKPALLQQIDAEFDKVKGEKPPAPTRGLRNQTTTESGGGDDGNDNETGADVGGGGIDVADLIPRTDISAKITEELLAEIADKNWKMRKDGLDKVLAILNEAKFITGNIGQLPEALKPRLGDANKILAMTTLTICQTLATSMGPAVKQHVRTIVPGIISNLGDSKPNVRQLATSALNALVDQAGLVVFIESELFPEAFKVENPVLRAELLGWMGEKLPLVKKMPVEFLECVPSLFACMEDRNPDVRKRAVEALLPFTILAGYENMIRQAGKLKPTSKDVVIKALEAIKANIPQKPAKAVQPVVKGGVGGGVVKPGAKSSVAASIDTMDDEIDDIPVTSKGTKTGIAVKGKAKVNGATGGSAPAAAAGTKKGVAVVSAGVGGKKKGQEEEDLAPPMKVTNGKDQRFKDEKTLKVLKWNFTAPRPEFVEQLRTQMELTFNRTLMDQLFHTSDFKLHIKALDTLIKVCSSDGVDATIANLDLILKWLTLRFFDTNTTVLMKELEYLQLVFNVLAEEDYHLHEFEAVSFVPYLVNKVGDPKDNIRRDVRTIFQQICRVYPAAKMFAFVLDGLKSKNAKQRIECLDELGVLIGQYGINVCQPSPAVALKLVAQQISDRDNSVRSASLDTIVIAYSIVGEAIQKYIGNLSDKDQSMLEERIKRSAKTGRPAPTALAAPVPVAATGKTSPDEKKHRPQAGTGPIAGVMGLKYGGTAAVVNAAATASRQGQFQLDVSPITPDSYAMPELLDTDLHDCDTAVQLPVTRTHARALSPGMKLLHTSADARIMVDLVISQIASNDVTTSLQALQQIDDVLKDSEKSEALQTHVDQLLITCTLQLRVAYTRHMTSNNVIHSDVIRLYRCLLATILSWTACPILAHEATRDVLKDLIYTLITILLDGRLNELEDGQNVTRSVNVTIVKIVEHADVTNVLSALIKLLHSTVGIETCSPNFLELVMKCLWKMVRMLPTIINDLNLDRIIADTHQFLKAFPGFTWKDRGNEMPLRTIKTLLHSLARLKGAKVLNHLSLIDPNEHSEVESYLRRMLRSNPGENAEAVSATNSRNDQLSGNQVGAAGHTSTSSTSSLSSRPEGDADRRSPRRISRTVHDNLAEIFKKIGSKENTREGLNDLYDFKLKHPDADLQPFLGKSSQFFQDYIERGLLGIQKEREAAASGFSSNQNNSHLSSSSSSINDNSPLANNTTVIMTSGVNNVQLESSGALQDFDGEETNTAAEYMARLRILRQRCGLEGTTSSSTFIAPANASALKSRSESTSSNDSLASGLPQDSGVSRPSSRVATVLPTRSTTNVSETTSVSSDSTIAVDQQSNLDELKKRLERIKNAGKRD